MFRINCLFVDVHKIRELSPLEWKKYERRDCDLVSVSICPRSGLWQLSGYIFMTEDRGDKLRKKIAMGGMKKGHR